MWLVFMGGIGRFWLGVWWGWGCGGGFLFVACGGVGVFVCFFCVGVYVYASWCGGGWQQTMGVSVPERDEVVMWSVLSRMSAIDSNTSTVGQGLSGALAKLTASGPVLCVLVNEDGALRSYVCSQDDRVSRQGVEDMARMVGARSIEMETPPVFRQSGEYVAVLRARFFQHLNFGSTQFGASPEQVVQQLAPSLRVGSWIAIVARKRGWFEERRYKKYVSFLREGHVQHYTTGTQGAVVASVYAGAGSRDEARMLCEAVAYAWPGFDVECDGVNVSAFGSMFPFVLGAILLAGLGVVARVMHVVSLDEWFWLCGASAVVLLMVGIVVGVVSRWRYHDRLPAPPHKKLIPAKGRKPSFDGSVSGRMPTYPLHRLSMFVSPQMVAFPFAPQAGSLSGSSVSFERKVPSVLRSPVGPLVGVADGEPVWVADPDAAAGVAVVGSPGMGKSVFLQSLAGYIFVSQARNVVRRFAPGKNNGVVIFETTHDGFQDYCDLYRQVTARVGAANPLVPVVAVDPDSAASLCLIPETYSPVQVAQLLTDGLEYSTDRGSVGSQSREALMTVLTAAAYVDEHVVDRARALAVEKGVPEGVIEYGKSIVTYAHILLTGKNDQVGGFLAQALHERLIAPDVDEDGRMADAQLGTIYGGISPAQRRTYTQAPRNKLARLIKVDHLFTPVAAQGQTKVTIRQVVEQHLNLVLLTGSDNKGNLMPDDTEKLVSALVSFCLQECVEQTCNGWYDRGLSTTIIVDELSTMAEFSEATLDWNRNKGRKYGVRPIYATQNPSQLSDQLRRTLLTFPVFVSFKADELSIATEIAQKMGSDGTVWEPSDVINMLPYTAHVLASYHRGPQPAFTVTSLWWRSEPGGPIRDDYLEWVCA